MEYLLEQVLNELKEIRNLLEQGTSYRKPGSRGYASHLTKEEKEDLENEIDLEWWFGNYGAEHLPAKYMNAGSAGLGLPADQIYNKNESDYIFNRLMDFVDEDNSDGTHTFKYLGKVWCKREGNARNCFAFVPKVQGQFLNDNKETENG